MNCVGMKNWVVAFALFVILSHVAADKGEPRRPRKKSARGYTTSSSSSHVHGRHGKEIEKSFSYTDGEPQRHPSSSSSSGSASQPQADGQQPQYQYYHVEYKDVAKDNPGDSGQSSEVDDSVSSERGRRTTRVRSPRRHRHYGGRKSGARSRTNGKRTQSAEEGRYRRNKKKPRNYEETKYGESGSFTLIQ